jgi:hypothetical protein
MISDLVQDRRKNSRKEKELGGRGFGRDVGDCNQLLRLTGAANYHNPHINNSETIEYTHRYF